MILPPPKLSTSWIHEVEKRSFRRLYTRILPSPFCSRKRDSSLKQILRQFWNVQPLNLLHQWTLSRLCNGVNTVPKYGLLCLMSCCWSRLRTVCELILRNPGIPAAVVDATTVRFGRWKIRRIYILKNKNGLSVFFILAVYINKMKNNLKLSEQF